MKMRSCICSASWHASFCKHGTGDTLTTSSGGAGRSFKFCVGVVNRFAIAERRLHHFWNRFPPLRAPLRPILWVFVNNWKSVRVPTEGHRSVKSDSCFSFIRFHHSGVGGPIMSFSSIITSSRDWFALLNSRLLMTVTVHILTAQIVTGNGLVRSRCAAVHDSVAPKSWRDIFRTERD